MSWTVKDRKLKKKTKRKSNYSKLGHAYSNMVELLEKNNTVENMILLLLNLEVLFDRY